MPGDDQLVCIQVALERLKRKLAKLPKSLRQCLDIDFNHG